MCVGMGCRSAEKMPLECEAKFEGARCTQCVNPRLTGLNCDVCIDPKFIGANCDQCADIRFAGDDCSVCSSALRVMSVPNALTRDSPENFATNVPIPSSPGLTALNVQIPVSPVRRVRHAQMNAFLARIATNAAINEDRLNL